MRANEIIGTVFSEITVSPEFSTIIPEEKLTQLFQAKAQATKGAAKAASSSASGAAPARVPYILSGRERSLGIIPKIQIIHNPN